jgi:hypothetical protein
MPHHPRLGMLLLAVLGAAPQSPAPQRHLVVEKRVVLQGLPDDLYQVLSLSVGRDSSFVILDRNAPFLWLLSPAGRLVRRIGANGSGPGEFRMPLAMGRRADSIWVWDPAVARLTVFSDAGTLGRSVALPSSGQATLLADGRVTVHTTRGYGTAGGVGQTRLQVRLVNRASANMGPVLFEAAYGYKVLEYRRGDGTTVGMQPFEDGPLFTACSDGSGFIYVDRQVTAGGAGTFGVTRIEPGGARRYSVRIPYLPMPITSDRMQRAVSELMREGPPDNSGLEARIRAAIARPAHLPTVSQMMCGSDGTVWLRREDTGAGPFRWTILDQHGTPTAALAIPRSVTPLSVTRDHAWTVEGDETSVRALVLWAVR